MRLTEMRSGSWSKFDQWTESWTCSRREEQPQSAALLAGKGRQRLRSRLVRQLLHNITGKQIAHGTTIIHGQVRTVRGLHSDGMIHRVDTVNREFTVFVNGERLAHTNRSGGRVALAIEM